MTKFSLTLITPHISLNGTLHCARVTHNNNSKSRTDFNTHTNSLKHEQHRMNGEWDFVVLSIDKYKVLQ